MPETFADYETLLRQVVIFGMVTAWLLSVWFRSVSGPSRRD